MTNRISRIARLSDRVRLGFDRNARIIMTATCLATLAGDDRRANEALAQAEVLAAIRRYVFKPEDTGERARGEFVIAGRIVRFTIDYYDRSLEWGSENPADPLVTTHVLTIMVPCDD